MKFPYGTKCTIRGAEDKALNGREVLLVSTLTDFPKLGLCYRTDLIYKGKQWFIPHGMLELVEFPPHIDHHCKIFVQEVTRDYSLECESFMKKITQSSPEIYDQLILEGDCDA